MQKKDHFSIDFLNASPFPFHVVNIGTNILKNRSWIGQKGVICPFLEIIWSISGVGEISLYEKKYHLHDNDVFYYLPGEDHSRRALSAVWEHRWICIYGPLAEAIFQSYRYPRCQNPPGCPVEIFREVETLVSRSDLYAKRRICSLVLELFARMGMEEDGEHMPSGNVVRNCMKLITANLSDPRLDLEMLSDSLNISRSFLTRIFREQAGVSLGRYILNRRSGLAMNLLRNTDLRISEVAAQCGFSQTRTFARFIRRITGVGPREFRRKSTEVPGGKAPHSGR